MSGARCSVQKQVIYLAFTAVPVIYDHCHQRWDCHMRHHMPFITNIFKQSILFILCYFYLPGKITCIYLPIPSTLIQGPTRCSAYHIALCMYPVIYSYCWQPSKPPILTRGAKGYFVTWPTLFCVKHDLKTITFLNQPTTLYDMIMTFIGFWKHGNENVWFCRDYTLMTPLPHPRLLPWLLVLGVVPQVI